jgi:hypothetical protein
MERVLADEELKHYRGKWEKKPKQTITKDYSCHTVFVWIDSTMVDTASAIMTDSLDLEVIPLEEFELMKENQQ